MTKAEKLYECEEWVKAQIKAGKWLSELQHTSYGKEYNKLKTFLEYGVSVYHTYIKDKNVFVEKIHTLDSTRYYLTLWSDSVYTLVKFIIENNINITEYPDNYTTDELFYIVTFFKNNYQTIINHEDSDKLINLLESMQECNLELVKQLINPI